MKSYKRCEIKVIDLGSSCFQSDNLCLYVQSRSYRAPEVMLGLSYDPKIDLWSLGCILAELWSGEVSFSFSYPYKTPLRLKPIEFYTFDLLVCYVFFQVLFPNEAVVMILARMIGLFGPINTEMLLNGQETHKYFTEEYDLYYMNEVGDKT